MLQTIKVGERVLVGAITPCGQCGYCLSGDWSQCGGPIGGWKFGNTIDGAQAEYLLVPNAQANLAKIPDDLSDEQVVLLADVASTGISAAESGGVKLGDTVAVFAQGPIGLCATAGAQAERRGIYHRCGIRSGTCGNGETDGSGRGRRPYSDGRCRRDSAHDRRKRCGRRD